jgi:hypothetical protein
MLHVALISCFVACSSYMLLIPCPETFLLILLVVDMPFSYLRVDLISEATRFTTILGDVALCYSIFP